MIGVTADHSSNGWNGVVRFAMNREMQNKDEFSSSKPKKEGVRELQNLSSYINYDNLKERTQ